MTTTNYQIQRKALEKAQEKYQNLSKEEKRQYEEEKGKKRQYGSERLKYKLTESGYSLGRRSFEFLFRGVVFEVLENSGVLEILLA